MDREIALDRLADRRERRQRAREYLAGKDNFETWIVNKLKRDGPTADASMVMEIIELCESGVSDDWNEHGIKSGLQIMMVAHAMWLLGKLRREEFPNHPSGEKCFIYRLP